MISLDDWRAIFWGFIDNTYEKDQRFYFSIEPNILLELANRHGLQVKSKSECINELQLSCQSLMSIRTPKSYLKETVFQAENDKPSYVICYVAQQVLAAELMSDSDTVSANNYYLRYREVLGLESGEGIPISYDQFERLWKVFAREVRGLKGAEPEQITFTEGSTRIDKYRHYPLSQSLLDKKSLNQIHASVKKISKKSDIALINAIRRPSTFNKLTPRSKRKVEVGFLLEAIIGQIRSFDDFEKEPFLGPRRSRKRSSGTQVSFNNFRLSVEEDFDFDESYEVWYQPSESSPFSESEAKEAFDTLITHSKEEPFIFFYHDGERYRAASYSEASTGIAEEFEVGWALVRNEAWGALGSIFSRDWRELFKPVENSVVPKGLALFELNGLPELGGSETSRTAEPQIQFKGGLCLDSRSLIFLSSYPPTSILYEGEKVDPRELIEVDGREEEVYVFFQRIKRESITRYFLKIRGVSKSLRVEREREHGSRSLIGLKLNRQELGTKSVKLEEHDLGLVHNILTAEIRLLAESGFRLREVERKSDLLKHLYLPLRHWVPVPEALQERFFSVSSDFFDSPAVSRFWRNIISARRALPVSLLTRNQTNRDHFGPLKVTNTLKPENVSSDELVNGNENSRQETENSSGISEQRLKAHNSATDPELSESADEKKHSYTGLGENRDGFRQERNHKVAERNDWHHSLIKYLATRVLEKSFDAKKGLSRRKKVIKTQNLPRENWATFAVTAVDQMLEQEKTGFGRHPKKQIVRLRKALSSLGKTVVLDSVVVECLSHQEKIRGARDNAIKYENTLMRYQLGSFIEVLSASCFNRFQQLESTSLDQRNLNSSREFLESIISQEIDNFGRAEQGSKKMISEHRKKSYKKRNAAARLLRQTNALRTAVQLHGKETIKDLVIYTFEHDGGRRFGENIFSLATSPSVSARFEEKFQESH